jgi:hypothetical protein
MLGSGAPKPMAAQLDSDPLEALQRLRRRRLSSQALFRSLDD